MKSRSLRLQIVVACCAWRCMPRGRLLPKHSVIDKYIYCQSQSEFCELGVMSSVRLSVNVVFPLLQFRHSIAEQHLLVAEERNTLISYITAMETLLCDPQLCNINSRGGCRKQHWIGPSKGEIQQVLICRSLAAGNGAEVSSQSGQHQAGKRQKGEQIAADYTSRHCLLLSLSVISWQVLEEHPCKGGKPCPTLIELAAATPPSRLAVFGSS